jgi:hypothetical protein
MNAKSNNLFATLSIISLKVSRGINANSNNLLDVVSITFFKVSNGREAPSNILSPILFKTDLIASGIKVPASAILSINLLLTFNIKFGAISAILSTNLLDTLSIESGIKVANLVKPSLNLPRIELIASGIKVNKLVIDFPIAIAVSPIESKINVPSDFNIVVKEVIVSDIISTGTIKTLVISF